MGGELYKISQRVLFSHSAQNTQHEDYPLLEARNTLFNPRMELNIKYIYFNLQVFGLEMDIHILYGYM